MKLIKFRIYNYKSIIDSGYCDLSTDFTILLGKNESGKTAVLEALRDFDKQVANFPEDAFPISGDYESPKLEMCFQVDEAELDAIQDSTGIKLKGALADYLIEKGLSLEKNCTGEYSIKDETLLRLLDEVNQGQRHYIRKEEKKIRALLTGYSIPELDLEASVPEIQERVQQLFVTIKSILPLIKEEDIQQSVIEALRFIKQESKDLSEQESQVDAKMAFLDKIKGFLPHFIFFNEFNDILPFEIPLQELSRNQAVLDFAKIARLDIDKIINTQDTQKRINILNHHSAAISGEFLNFWGQNQMELIIRPEGDKLLFGVKEANRTELFKIQQRSKGFQWFLSFYLRLNSQKGASNVILIDEPGMNLHAKAQNEIIKVLEHLTLHGNQIVFSTHSPYLLDDLRLDRIRLVLKDPASGTVLESNLSMATDDETLTPLISLFKLGLSHRLSMLETGKINVIVDGLANYYFLDGMQCFDENVPWADYHFIPASDISEIRQMASLMVGSKMNFLILLDFNQDSEKLANILQETLGLDATQIIFINAALDQRVEDLFSKEDFCRILIGEDPDEESTLSNSTYLKTHNKNRVWLAKKFTDLSHKKDRLLLSQETLSSFRQFINRVFRSGEDNAPPQDRKEKSLFSEIRRFPFFPKFGKRPELTQDSKK